MPNTRSKPITGHITDSAGNTVRNSKITVKLANPRDEIVVDSTRSDDNGYFSTTPLPNNDYTIYDEGVAISNVLHRPDISAIPCYKALSTNTPSSRRSFASIISDPSSKVDDYIGFIQLEQEHIDTSITSTYPIDAGVIPASMETFLGIQNGVITTTRFDVEYHNEHNVAGDNFRCAGVPAIRYNVNSKLVIPIDYNSIVLVNSKQDSTTANVTSSNADNIEVEISEFSAPGSVGVTPGDVIVISRGADVFYGILRSISNVGLCKLDKMNTTSYVSGIVPVGDNASASAYTGLQSVDNISNVYEKFTVTENIVAQNTIGGIYNYG